MLLNPLTHHSPVTLPEACRIKVSLERSEILAGGTFLINRLKLLKKKGLQTPLNIISLKKVAGLSGIYAKEGVVIIKALTTIRQILDSKLIALHLPVLKDISSKIGTSQIRNMATVGGNLTCRYPWTEMPAVMIALGAKLHFSTERQEQLVSAEDFFKNEARSPGILESVSIPLVSNQRASYVRCKKTLHLDIPLLAACVTAEIKAGRFQNTRVTINRGTAFPVCLEEMESLLNGQPAQHRVIEHALAQMNPKTFDASTDDYKIHMYKVSVRQALTDII